MESDQAKEISARITSQSNARARRSGDVMTQGDLDFRTLLKTVPEVIWAVDAEGRLEYVNRPLHRTLGLTTSKLLSDGWRRVIHPDDLAYVIAHWEQSRQTGKPFRAEFRSLAGRSTYRWHEARAAARRDSEGMVIGWSGVVSDIEELRAARSAAEEAEQKTRSILESISDAFFATDRDWRLTYVNDRAAQMLGRSREELIGRFAWTEFRPSLGTVFEHMLHRAMLTGEVAIFEEWYAPTGSWFEVRAYPRHDGLSIYFTDATDRHLAMVERDRLLAMAEAAQREAEGQRERAEIANQAKTDFLATMSHEVRTPINAILGYADLMDLGVVGPLNEQQREFLDRLTASGRHLLGLVDEILDLTRVESGRLSIVEERADLRALVESALALVGPQAAQRGLALEYDCEPPEGQVVIGDEGRIRQILVNLLTNAIKFTDASVSERSSVDALDSPRQARGDARAARRIHVSCGSGGSPDGRSDSSSVFAGRAGWHYIRVTDPGIGIPAEQLEEIFEPFMQVEKKHARTRSGAGLGLAISRRLARLMGGDLTVASKLGEGSTFTLWLPAFRGAEAGTIGTAAGLHGGDEERAAMYTIGQWLAEEAESLTLSFIDRLRQDPIITPARTMSEYDLVNHISTFLLDVAKALPALAASSEPTAAMHDSSEIQELIAERHGAQRFRMGFTEAMVDREVVLLSDFLIQALREWAPEELRHHLDRALEVLTLQLDQGGRISRRGYRNAREVARATSEGR